VQLGGVEAGADKREAVNGCSGAADWLDGGYSLLLTVYGLQSAAHSARGRLECTGQQEQRCRLYDIVAHKLPNSPSDVV
jgi:hypothetical protein